MTRKLDHFARLECTGDDRQFTKCDFVQYVQIARSILHQEQGYCETSLLVTSKMVHLLGIPNHGLGTTA